MTAAGEFLRRCRSFGAEPALVWQNRALGFDELLLAADSRKREFTALGLGSGAVVALEGDFSPNSIAILLALMELGAVAVPLTTRMDNHKREYGEIAEVEWRVAVDAEDRHTIQATGRKADHELIGGLRREGHAGLILFTSGTTGRGKAVVHDLERLLAKYLKPRHCYRTLAFLLFDHIGGVDTLLYSLANGSCLIRVSDRRPDTVCAAIEKHAVEVLPAAPSFLNLLLLSRAHEYHDLSSLKIITYGSEVIPQRTLSLVSEAFPCVKLVQKFGITEIGTMRSQSRDSGSTWVRVGGEGYQTRIVEGVLQVKAESAMLGYLNAPSPWTEDGWYDTGDLVEVEGDFVRFLGRQSDIINVGGEKVYPAEVESAIREMDGIEEVVVFGERHPLTGSIVCARVRLYGAEDPQALTGRLKRHCHERLARYKVPLKVVIDREPRSQDQIKSVRRPPL